MAVQIYTFKITYADCDNRIWRTAAVSSNYTLAELGYMALATFDTMAYHLFEMKYRDTTYFLTEEDFEDLPYEEDEKYDLLEHYKIGKLGMNIGNTIEMIYDFGGEQVFISSFWKSVICREDTDVLTPRFLTVQGEVL